MIETPIAKTIVSSRRRRGLGWLTRFQGSDELTGPGTPFRKNPECGGKWHIHWMHSLWRQDVYRSSHWCRHRRHQHRKGTVFQFLDNQCGNQCLLHLGETWRECRVVRLTHAASGEALQQGVAGEPL